MSEVRYYIDKENKTIYKADSSWSKDSFQSYMEAKKELVKQMTFGFNTFCKNFERLRNELVKELETVSGFLEETDCEDKVEYSRKPEKERFRLVFDENLGKDSEFNHLYKWYEEVGIKFDGEYMVSAHSEALDWVASKVFGTTSYLSKKDFVKMPKDKVIKAIRIFESLTPKKYGSYNLEDVEWIWNNEE